MPLARASLVAVTTATMGRNLERNIIPHCIEVVKTWALKQLFLVNRDRAHTLRLLRLVPHMGSERVTKDSTR
jgi:hypothetical protein